MSKTRFTLARNPLTGEFEWSAQRHGRAQTWLGWLIMAVSTLVFLLVAGYVGYWLLLSATQFQPAALTDGGSGAMRDAVRQLTSGQ